MKQQDYLTVPDIYLGDGLISHTEKKDHATNTLPWNTQAKTIVDQSKVENNVTDEKIEGLKNKLQETIRDLESANTKLSSERACSGWLRSDLVKADHAIEALNELIMSKEEAIGREKKDCHGANNQAINQVVNLKAEKSIAPDETARVVAEKNQANQKLADALKQFKAAENRASVAEGRLWSAGEENRRLQDELQQ